MALKVLPPFTIFTTGKFVKNNNGIFSVKPKLSSDMMNSKFYIYLILFICYNNKARTFNREVLWYTGIFTNLFGIVRRNDL